MSREARKNPEGHYPDCTAAVVGWCVCDLITEMPVTEPPARPMRRGALPFLGLLLCLASAIVTVALLIMLYSAAAVLGIVLALTGGI